MDNKLSAGEFEEASVDWKLPEKNEDSSEVQLFTIETDEPHALDKFLKLFGAHLVTCERGSKFQRLNDETYVIWTKVNSPYVYQMVLANETVGRNCQPFDMGEEENDNWK